MIANGTIVASTIMPRGQETPGIAAPGGERNMARAASTPTSWSGTRRSFPTATAQRILRRDKTCRGCGSSGPLQADHIVNHAEALLFGWTQEQIDHEDNGQALCHDCHAKKSQAEQLRGVRRHHAPKPKPLHPGVLR